VQLNEAPFPPSGQASPARRFWIGGNKQGAEEVELTATSFAERSEKTRQLVWDNVPEGQVICALLDNRENPAQLKVVTRPANEAELIHFEHPRLPLLQKRRFEPVPPAEEEPDLFTALGA
jgi:hypothetical protein